MTGCRSLSHAVHVEVRVGTLPVQMAGRSGRAAVGALDNSPLDESFVVPALVRFNGHPEVDDAGNLIYTFPDLQASSREKARCCRCVPAAMVRCADNSALGGSPLQTPSSRV